LAGFKTISILNRCFKNCSSVIRSCFRGIYCKNLYLHCFVKIELRFEFIALRENDLFFIKKYYFKIRQLNNLNWLNRKLKILKESFND